MAHKSQDQPQQHKEQHGDKSDEPVARHTFFIAKRAQALVAVVRVVVVQRAVRIDVADVVGVRRIRRIKMYPERFSSSRFVPLLPRGRHVLHFKRKF